MKRPKFHNKPSFADYVYRGILFPAHIFTRPLRNYATTPNITQPSFWQGLILKPFRTGQNKRHQAFKAGEWNPLTFYIIMLLLIGSNSIQMISMEKSYAAFTRKTNARIGLLEDVIKRVKKGEKVDVEDVLGTGCKKREQEWKDVLKDIENHTPVWNKSSQRSSDYAHNTQVKSSCTKEPYDSMTKSPAKSEEIRVPPGFF